MNDKQFLQATRNVVRLEDLSADIVRKIAPELWEIFKQVGRLMRSMPEGEVMRQMQYRQMQQRIASMFIPTNERFKNELREALGREVEYQMHRAEAYLNVAEVTQKQRAAAAAVQPGISTVPSALPSVTTSSTALGQTATLGNVPLTLGPANFELGSQITRTQLMALVDDTQVLGKRLEDLFAVYVPRKNGAATDLGPWLKSNMTIIDRVTKTGFITGMTNDEIADEIAKAARTSQVQAKAIARTAVMDMSQRAHNRMWDENRDVIAAYEYSAVFDYRVCEQCAPWSGAVRRKRSELPQTPRHPNCRCMVLPLTQTEWELRKDEPLDASFVELVPGEKVLTDKDGKPLKTAAGKWRYKNIDHPKAKKGERYYANPVFVNGKRYWRKAVDLPAQGRDVVMADFLRRASRQTQNEVLGVERANWFRALVSQKDRFGNYAMDSQAALMKVLPRSLDPPPKVPRGHRRGRKQGG